MKKKYLQFRKNTIATSPALPVKHLVSDGFELPHNTAMTEETMQIEASVYSPPNPEIPTTRVQRAIVIAGTTLITKSGFLYVNQTRHLSKASVGGVMMSSSSIPSLLIKSVRKQLLK